MNNILASVTIPPNQKQPNRNSNDAAKTTPIVKKLGGKPIFNQTKINQNLNVPINTNPAPPVSVQYYKIPLPLHKIIPYPSTQQTQNNQQPPLNKPIQKVAQVQPVQQVQQSSIQEQLPIQKPPVEQIIQPIPKPEPPTADQEINNCLLSTFKKRLLLYLTKSGKTESIQITKSKQSRNSGKNNSNSQNETKQDKKNSKAVHEQKNEKSEIYNYDQTFLENFFFDKYHDETKINRLSRRQPIPPFNPHYETWEKIGHGYLVNPNPPCYYVEPHFVDFICQCKLKALAIGGEGTSVYASKDEQAPLLASNARLQLSMLIDEHGIDHLKVEAKIKNASYRNAKPGTIDKLAKLCNSLEIKVREYNDDIRNQYRNPPIVPYDLKDFISEQNEKEKERKGKKARVLDYYIIPDHCKFPLDDIHFLTYAIRMIELTSILTPKHCLHITKAFTLVFPLIMKAIVRPEKEWHFIGKRIHLTYFYRLFHLLNRLSEYFCTIPMIPCQASFGIIQSLRSDITATWQKELHKISDNIEYGGCLSWLLCEMRDISLALTIHLNDVKMIEEVIKLYDRYEKYHPERFPHSNNYNRNYLNKIDQRILSAKESYYRNRNVKHTKRGGYNASGGAGKRINFRKMSGTRFIYNNDNMKDESIFAKKFVYKENDKYDFTMNDLLKIACRENNDQRIYMMKFVVDKEGLLSFIVKQPEEEEVQKVSRFYNLATPVPPFYPFIIKQQKTKPKKDDEVEVPVYVPSNDSFKFDAAYPTLEKFGKPVKIHFEPNSQQSFFSLNLPRFY